MDVYGRVFACRCQKRLKSILSAFAGLARLRQTDELIEFHLLLHRASQDNRILLCTDSHRMMHQLTTGRPCSYRTTNTESSQCSTKTPFSCLLKGDRRTGKQCRCQIFPYLLWYFRRSLTGRCSTHCLDSFFRGRHLAHIEDGQCTDPFQCTDQYSRCQHFLQLIGRHVVR